MTQFILTLNKNSTASDFQALVSKYSMVVLIDYNALTQVFKIDMDPSFKAAVRAEPTVWHVAPANAVVNLMVKVESVSALQNPDIVKTSTKISPLANNQQPISVRADGYGGNWGLMRICRKSDWNKNSWYPITNSYVSYRTGKNSDVYVVDSGINKNHIDFNGRFTVIYDHYRTPTDPTFGQDTLGHGTHVASCIAGTIHGVAKEAQIYVSRVFDANSASLDAIVAGINACLTHHKNKIQQKINRPSVMNLSLGGDPNITEQQLVTACIDAGIVVCAAAGNDGMNLDAPGYDIMPAEISRALTVGATDIQDNITTFSNYGKKIDVFAPGMYITGADWRTVSGENMMSGTSMATPFVAGVVALKMDGGSIGTNGAFVDMIANWVIGVATINSVKMTQAAVSSSTPNKLLYSYFTTPETAIVVQPVVVKEVSRHTNTKVVSTESKGSPQVRTSYVDVNSSIINTDKSTTNTTTREYTDVTYIVTTIRTVNTPVTTVLYSNNKTEIINGSAVITNTTREDVVSTQKRSVVISQNTIPAPSLIQPTIPVPPVVPVQPTPPVAPVVPSIPTKITKVTTEMLLPLLPKYMEIKQGDAWKKIEPQVLSSYDSTLNEIELLYVNKYTINNSQVELKMISLIQGLLDYATMKGTLRFATYRKISQLKDELKYSLMR